MRAGGLSPATRRGVLPGCGASSSFNEGRGFIPGNAVSQPGRLLSGQQRSMRAGGLSPATLAAPHTPAWVDLGRSMRAGGLSPATPVQRVRAGAVSPAFNEGRGFIPGNALGRCRFSGSIAPFNEGRGFIPGNASKQLERMW